jgi:flagellar hook-associated protein 1 FlgK
MSAGLFGILGNSGHALDALERALSVVQANVSNASTPGYATQQVALQSGPMDPVTGSGGTLTSAGVVSSRDPYADTAVELQRQTLGRYTAQAQSTGTIQSFFDVTGATGVSPALTNLFRSFSAWSASPNDPPAQQGVLTAAAGMASAINSLSASLNQTSTALGQQVNSTVSQINGIAAQIQQYNVARIAGGQSDPGAEAQLQTNLESLANLVNITALTQSNGTITLMVGGGTPLVMGNQQFSLTSGQSVLAQPPAANPQSPPTSQVLDSQGRDITSELTGGHLGGLLDSQNRVLAGIIGDSQNTGSLNVMAKNLADTVNQILTAGTVSTAAGAPAGTALFTYSAADATATARTLTVNPAITAGQLAPVDAAGNANGNASALAALATASGGPGTINGLTFIQFLGSIASGVGQENQTAQNNQQSQQSVLSQAQTLRDSISGVSINAQAALLLQYQHGFQAISQVLQVANKMADSILSIIP